ncbi:MAG: putative anaerobic reductase component [Planctomycetaceae bacterium]|nr:putative anaerobic reductase component [Planctomycetaceae bacterium]
MTCMGQQLEPPATGLGLLEQLLHDQQHMTVVAKFAQELELHALPAQAKFYRDLIPLTSPKPGEQLAFEVDLDACSGCKACVVACHNLNGLEEDEIWRSVGLLSGGSMHLPVIQHVTSACHHCIEPACLQGCPVNAYEKDPVTGIVRHLDDQCIGCQYCVLKCPYDVPKFSPSKGIVRKCDMCSSRLAVGEAPACVQSCPNQAIRITIVNKQAIIEESEASQFVPGAADPSYTLPTTVYKTARPLPRNLLPADYYSAAPQHAHMPLVFMLVLTQMSVGAFTAEQLLNWLSVGPSLDVIEQTRPVHLLAAFGLGMLGLVASLFHLGRPFYAFRAFIGLRTSWLSREILCFGLFATLAALYTVLPWISASWLSHWGLAVSQAQYNQLGWAVVASGLSGVWCSVMLYDSTRRILWHWPRTGFRFLMTCALLGAPTSLLISFAAAVWSSSYTIQQIMDDYGRVLCGCLVLLGGIKMLFEASVFRHLLARQLTPLKRTAMLMQGDLARVTLQRFFCGLAGCVVLPAILLVMSRTDSQQSVSPRFVVAATVCSLGFAFLGEVLERYLFFTSVIAPKMPGTPAA